MKPDFSHLASTQSRQEVFQPTPTSASALAARRRRRARNAWLRLRNYVLMALLAVVLIGAGAGLTAALAHQFPPQDYPVMAGKCVAWAAGGAFLGMTLYGAFVMAQWSPVVPLGPVVIYRLNVDPTQEEPVNSPWLLIGLIGLGTVAAAVLGGSWLTTTDARDIQFSLAALVGAVMGLVIFVVVVVLAHRPPAPRKDPYPTADSRPPDQRVW
jgi:hypothetical protein